jgi:hypothetical protein
MGRRLRCSSVTSSTSLTFCINTGLFCDPSNWCWMRPARALPAAHFERNDITVICETVH